MMCFLFKIMLLHIIGLVMSKLFSWYFKPNLLLRILIGLILGSICGIIFQNAQTAISILSPIGELFIRLLKMIVIPVIASTLIVGQAQSRLPSLGVSA